MKIAAGCLFFLGSLNAGGTGIDLVGGSGALHYDRWWNAARGMMDSVVQEDDPHLAKIFTRDELLEMLRGE